jgi:pyruvate, water dikinase
MHTRSPQVLWYKDIGRGDVARVGGKNASLGEMVRNLGEKGVKVPPGFATTAEAYWQYVEANGLRRVIADSLKALDGGHASLAQIGATVRQEFLRGTLPKDLADAIQSAYRQLCSRANGETGMWLFAPAPRPKTCPTQALPDSRRAI